MDSGNELIELLKKKYDNAPVTNETRCLLNKELEELSNNTRIDSKQRQLAKNLIIDYLDDIERNL